MTKVCNPNRFSGWFPSVDRFAMFTANKIFILRSVMSWNQAPSPARCRENPSQISSKKHQFQTRDTRASGCCWCGGRACNCRALDAAATVSYNNTETQLWSQAEKLRDKKQTKQVKPQGFIKFVCVSPQNLTLARCCTTKRVLQRRPDRPPLRDAACTHTRNVDWALREQITNTQIDDIRECILKPSNKNNDVTLQPL